ncbi:MAG: hypothetical protein NT113_22915 [Hyphomicrobiales bacterium]|nr:hypothetical protein [Hyphomicrobiales bacterium]
MLRKWKALPSRQTREIRLSSHPMVPEGKQVLWRNGEVVCIVSVGDRFGDQTGDVAFDHIQMNPAEYERFEKASALTVKHGTDGAV